MIFVCSRVTRIPYSLNNPHQIILNTNTESPLNIASKVSYRHLRGMYYLWKNPDLFDNPDTVTIFQERRKLFHDYIQEGFTVTQPKHMNLQSILLQWRSCSEHPAHRMEYLEAALSLLPRMKEYVNIVPAPCAYFHNMGTYPWEIYDQLCDFIFTTLNLLEVKLNINPDEELPVYAMLAERIQNYWLWEHPEIKVFESPLDKYDSVS